MGQKRIQIMLVEDGFVFLSGGYFAEGIQNTLVELSKPHAEGMNQAFDAFRLVNFDSANPKRYMQNNTNPSVPLTLFSDRLTCAYCQEVAFRATQNRDYYSGPRN